jgi:3-oxoacyl-[acyl-carrier protein] reductase
MYPELAGKRVLITGIASDGGVDIARSFAEHKTRLVLQFAESSESMQAVAEITTQAALEMKLFGPVSGQPGDAIEFGRNVVKSFGGLDAVINLVRLHPVTCDTSMTAAEVEKDVAARLLLPFVLANIAANRMSLSLTEGLILNVAILQQPISGPEQMLAIATKSALVAITRRQAEEWADRGIRFNAIAPQTAPMAPVHQYATEPDVAALALYLASGRGKSLTGHVFDPQSTDWNCWRR